MPTYYVTKYALSNNSDPTTIESHETPDETGYISLRVPGHMWSTGFRMGRDAFVSEEEARKAVIKARDKKIASLEKQIAALRKIGGQHD